MGRAATPYGLYPRKSLGSRRHTAGDTAFAVTVNSALPMYWGAPVVLIGGGVKAVTATPAAGAPTVGVLQGAYMENLGCIPWTRMIPANAITSGAKKVIAFVNDDPDLWFMVQATAAVPEDAIGKNALLLNWADGNAQTGRSTCRLDAGSIALTATHSVRIIRNLTPGDPYPDLLVQWNAGVHQYNGGIITATLEEQVEVEIDPDLDPLEQVKRLDQYGRLLPETPEEKEKRHKEYKERKAQEKKDAEKAAKDAEKAAKDAAAKAEKEAEKSEKQPEYASTRSQQGQAPVETKGRK